MAKKSEAWLCRVKRGVFEERGETWFRRVSHDKVKGKKVRRGVAK
jgi:hypothetical protein